MMPSNILLLPVLLPLLAAAVCLVFRGRPMVQRTIALIGSLAQLTTAIILLVMVANHGPIAISVGSWKAPVGIVFVADALAAIMTLLTAVVGTLGAWYSFGRMAPEEEGVGHHPLILALLAGVAGAFLTGDLFNLFVWFEVLLMASFVLLGLGIGAWRREGTVKYLVLNLFASTCFLSAVGLIYAESGSLTMAALALESLAAGDGPPPVAAWLLLTAFAIKAGLFPCYLWLPGAYHNPAPVVSAIFAALLTKVGVYALIRTTGLLFAGQAELLNQVLVVAGIATMISGALGALAQSHLRRILAFHVISQVGFMVMAIGLGTAAALAAASVYLVHHIVVKAALFLVGGRIAHEGGNEKISELGGLLERRPWMAIAFLIPALSLAGIPPFSGFIAKFAVTDAAVELEAWWVVAFGLIGGLLTLLSMLKIWLAVCWGEAKANPEPPAEPQPEKAPNVCPAWVLVGATIVIGIFGAPLVDLATEAGEQLTNPQAYVTAVLPGDK
jgi:multicomponent Na+:H+ antiporter subunit D